MFTTYVARTFHGLEPILAKELEALGAQNVLELKRAVSFEADTFFYYKANYWLRTALCVLVPIAQGKVKNETDLYDLVKKVHWEKYVSVDGTIAVDSTVHSDFFNHTKYVALKSKDAIVDRFRELYGKRPNVDVERPNLKIHIHIDKDQCNISLDSSGDALFKRGYRQETNDAPINEILAAGMIQHTNWDQQVNFYDPMCGSGTIPIEAAFIAANMSPQANRKFFAFMNWPNFSRTHWEKVKEEAFKVKTTPKAKIYASDMSMQAIRIATENARRAGVLDYIDFNRVSFELSKAPDGDGIIVTNPPYGERLQAEEEIFSLYKKIGDTLKTKYEGYDAFIISSNLEALKHVGLRATRRIQLFNGALECKLMKFSIYRGSKKYQEEETANS